MIYRKVKKIPSEQMEAFWSAADHRLAEITMGKIFTRIPRSVWGWVK
ncbi:Hha/YmoA family nucleoid-associated regulatory protein [Providencia rettgeri]